MKNILSIVSNLLTVLTIGLLLIGFFLSKSYVQETTTAIIVFLKHQGTVTDLAGTVKSGKFIMLYYNAVMPVLGILFLMVLALQVCIKRNY
jgi:hypothetical protein